jgi:hypothetical protein
MCATTCHCKSYKFPHRSGGGACLARQDGPFCGDCGEPAETQDVDFGYGVTEFWGHVSNHRDVRTVSACCEADLFADASLRIDYQP